MRLPFEIGIYVGHIRLYSTALSRPIDRTISPRYIVLPCSSEGRQPVTLVGGAGCGARASGLVSRAPGRPWVTVRAHYEGLPLKRLDGTGRAGRKPRAGAGEEPAVRVPEDTVPKPKIAAVERRKATRCRYSAPAERR